jgi:hypothetical protein
MDIAVAMSLVGFDLDDDEYIIGALVIWRFIVMGEDYSSRKGNTVCSGVELSFGFGRGPSSEWSYHLPSSQRAFLTVSCRRCSWGNLDKTDPYLHGNRWLNPY